MEYIQHLKKVVMSGPTQRKWLTRALQQYEKEYSPHELHDLLTQMMFEDADTEQLSVAFRNDFEGLFDQSVTLCSIDQETYAQKRVALFALFEELHQMLRQKLKDNSNLQEKVGRCAAWIAWVDYLHETQVWDTFVNECFKVFSKDNFDLLYNELKNEDEEDKNAQLNQKKREAQLNQKYTKQEIGEYIVNYIWLNQPATLLQDIQKTPKDVYIEAFARFFAKYSEENSNNENMRPYTKKGSGYHMRLHLYNKAGGVEQQLGLYNQVMFD